MTSKAEYDFYPDGTLDKYWKNEEGQVSRDDGPALEYAEGIREWFKNGLRHRENGPAIIWDDGFCLYYLNDNLYFKKEYWKEIEKIKKRRERKDKRIK